MPESNSTYEAFERALATPPAATVRLRLYVSGASTRSLQAVANLKRICEEHLNGRYELEVIDLYQQPDVAAAVDLVVAPTLVKMSPPPMRRLIGTLSDADEVLRRLDVIRPH